MYWICIGIGFLSIVLSYWLWVLIHEYSHLLVLRNEPGYFKYDLKLIPKYNHKTQYITFASITPYWKRKLTDEERYKVHIAPAQSDLIGMYFTLWLCLIFGLSGVLIYTWPLIIFAGGSFVDLFFALQNDNPHGDFMRAAKMKGITLKNLRKEYSSLWYGTLIASLFALGLGALIHG